jgi:hypothetical protein
MLLGLALVSLAGCGDRQLTWQEKMDSSAGVEREQAVMTVADQNNRAAIPQLIQRLEDDDIAVRMAAIDSLRKMTGKDFGYVAWDDEVKRREAVRQWKAWWQSEGGRATAPTGGKP